MKKRMFALLLTFFVMVGMLSVTASAESYPKSGSCGDGVTWSASQYNWPAVFTISGTGPMDDWDWDAAISNPPPWANEKVYDFRMKILDLVIEPGVTHIGDDAFAGCRYMATANLPDSITSIGDDAFYVCEGLWDFEMPPKVTTIEEKAFYQCTSLKRVSLPDTLTHVEKDAFAQCGELTVVLSQSLYERIDRESVFAGCESVTFENSADGSTIDVFSPQTNPEEKPEPSEIHATGVQLNRTSIQLQVDEEIQLSATVSPSDADNQNVIWSSSDESVATVDQNGSAVGVSAGTAKIEVETEDGGFTASCTVTVEEQEELVEIPFRDVSDSAWYRKAVGYAWENNLFSGTSDTTFSPDTGMTRGMFVTVLGRKTGIDTDDYMRYRFLDTKLGEYYAPYVEWAAEYSIVSGTSKANFSPNQKITREQMATILYRYAQKTGNDTSYSEERYSSFTDAGKVSNFAKTAMKWATSQGVLNGSNGKLDPQGTATRAQVAQVFFNCQDLLKNTVVSGDPVLVPEPKLKPVSINKLSNYQSLSKGMTAGEFQQAYNEALKIVEDLNGYNKKSQLLNIAIRLRALDDAGIEYSTTAPHYADAYGYFISKKASCAGCARATGLCLNILGYPYEHVNEGAWSHQWCRVKVGSEYWICDAYGLYCGPEPAPYKHPTLS